MFLGKKLCAPRAHARSRVTPAAMPFHLHRRHGAWGSVRASRGGEELGAAWGREPSPTRHPSNLERQRGRSRMRAGCAPSAPYFSRVAWLSGADKNGYGWLNIRIIRIRICKKTLIWIPMFVSDFNMDVIWIYLNPFFNNFLYLISYPYPK